MLAQWEVVIIIDFVIFSMLQYNHCTWLAILQDAYPLVNPVVNELNQSTTGMKKHGVQPPVVSVLVESNHL